MPGGPARADVQAVERHKDRFRSELGRGGRVAAQFVVAGDLGRRPDRARREVGAEVDRAEFPLEGGDPHKRRSGSVIVVARKTASRRSSSLRMDADEESAGHM